MGAETVVRSYREVATLADAREAVFVLRPERDAALSVWVEFHRANAAMYERVAELDERHHWEALYWVGYEMRQVEKLTKRPEWKSGYGDAR
ncbi:AMED_5909 family protein [Amycolatopsis sp. lyj-346]|uniref:AMED_5909 family protein n=1 Tax=Amycolatopsis sp. lyj-346 TaxID=2789289 RepID=UPI00397B05AC